MSEITVAAAPEPLSEEDRRSILEDAGVFAPNPSKYPGLSLQLDPSQALDSSFRPVGYDTRLTTGEMVHCSICAQHQEHFDGAIVRLQDGKTGLVGNSCGKKHFFGDNGWSVITSKIRQDEERAIFSARFGPAKESIATVDELLRKWVSSLRGVEAMHDQFKTELPQLFAAIGRQVQTGVLSIDKERQIPVRQSNGDIKMITDFYQVVICRVEADWFFLGDRLAQTVDRIRPQIIESFGYLSADATTQNITAVKRLMKTCRDSLEIVAKKQEKLKSLKIESTVAKISEWGNLALNSKEKYKVSGQLLFSIQNENIQGSFNFEDFPSDLDLYWHKILENWPRL